MLELGCTLVGGEAFEKKQISMKMHAPPFPFPIGLVPGCEIEALVAHTRVDGKDCYLVRRRGQPEPYCEADGGIPVTEEKG